MSNFFEYVHLLEHFTSAVLILNIDFVNRLDSHILACQLVYAQRDLSKGTLAQELYILVELKSSVWDLSILSNICFDILDQLLTVLRDVVIKNHFLL